MQHPVIKMDKQQALDFIHQQLSAGHSVEQVTADLAARLGAPPNAVRSFVATAAAEYQAAMPAVSAAAAPGRGSGTAGQSAPGTASPRAAPAASPAAPPAAPVQAPARGTAAPAGRFVPAQPELDQQTIEAAEKMVLAELMRGTKRSDIAVQVCEQTGLSYEYAQRLVARVATRNSEAISARHNRLVLILSLLALGAGLVLVIVSTAELAAYGTRIASGDYSTAMLPPDDAPPLFFMGFMLLVGGGIGLFRARRA